MKYITNRWNGAKQRILRQDVHGQTLLVCKSTISGLSVRPTQLGRYIELDHRGHRERREKRKAYMETYETTIEYWEQKFGERLSTNKRYDAQKQLPYLEIEEGLKWLAQEAESIIDFGCGPGSILLRSVFFGIQKAIGIDISQKAIELAQQTSIQNNMDTKTTFIAGSVESLEKCEDDSLDAGILFNVIDNVLPDDAILVLKEMHRILKTGGKLLIKLNDCSPPEEFEGDDYFQLISEDFYKEKSGLYFWNLSEKKFKEIVSPYFEIVKYSEVPFPDTNYINRLYYLKKI